MKVSFEASTKTKKVPPVLREGDLVTYGDDESMSYLVCSAPMEDTRSYFIVPLKGARPTKILFHDSLEALTNSLQQSLTFYRHEDITLDLTNVPSHTLKGDSEG